MQKKKSRRGTWMPNYAPNEEERKYHAYCVSNNIIISPWGIHGDANHWRIRIGDNISPKKFSRDEIWKVYYEYCKYYYDKNENKI